jgi:HD superfamily phosphohydrolase YqeK
MTQAALVVNGIALPSWSRVSERRLEHIARVVSLLDTWVDAMSLTSDEAAEWRDAGAWHDALRDADGPTLRQLTGDNERPEGMLHGFAAANLLRADGETRTGVLDAVQWHTVGYPAWNRAGRALYMADFLEPGRKFMQADRAFLASLVPQRFDDVFRQVVRMRLEWTVREGKGLAVEMVQLWNSVR